MIEFRDVYKSFGDFHVLKGVNLIIPKGKTTVILGRSGSGKSVILKTILGFLKPDRGTSFLDGRDTSLFSSKDWQGARKRIGMLFQDSALFDSMDVFANVAFPLREHTRKKNPEIRSIVFETLKLVGLKGHEFKNVSDLSGGMKKRVAMARAIVMEPEIVLLDEPTTGLDPIVTTVINNLIQETQQHLSGTYVVISHDIDSSLNMAHHVAMLYDGSILMSGSPGVIRKSDNPIIQQFIRGELDGPFNIFY